MARTERLFQRQMIAASDYDKDRFAYLAAKATYAKAKADLERVLAGTWKEDIEVARAAVQLAQSQVETIKTNLERLTVRAPMDGEVLQLNVRLGQFAALTWKEPMIVLGDIKRLHVRVDIDENDLPYFSKGAEAVATLKGRPQVRFPLEVRLRRALRHPQAEPDRLQLRAGRHAGPPGDLRAARGPADGRLHRPADGRLPQGRPPSSESRATWREDAQLPFEEKTACRRAGQVRRVTSATYGCEARRCHGQIRLARCRFAVLVRRIVGRDDSKLHDLGRGGVLGDLVVEDDGQVVVARRQPLERDHVLQIDEPRRLRGSVGLYSNIFCFWRRIVFLTALADLEVRDEMGLILAVRPARS